MREFKLALLLVAFACVSGGSTAALAAMKEGRAVWVTRWEWTGSRNRTADQYKIRRILDDLRSGRFNMAFWQVRGQADAFYRSDYEPWAKELTGTLGQDPGWDPLAYVVRQAHSRGIELHAWVNVYPMWRGTSPPPHTNPEHIYHLHYPDWVCYDASGKPMELNDSYIFVSPGNPEAREHILNVCLDIVSKYDVDGLHFDYIRYPGTNYSHDPVSLQRFSDPAENPDNLSWADWQREQVSAFVREFYHRAMQIRPELKVSAALIGKYNAPWTGWDGYNIVYQDGKAWAREGTIDILCPMLYWPIGPDSPAPFERYLRQWLEEDPPPRPVMAGIGAYKYKDNLLETVSQIDTCRALGAAGQVMFSYTSIDDPGYWDELVATSYTTLANVPPSPWKDADPPNAPQNLHLAELEGGKWQLDWDAPLPAADGEIASYYNIYRSVEAAPADPFEARYLFSITTDTATFFTDTRASASHQYYYWVSALDKVDNESEIAEIAYTSVETRRIASLPRDWALLTPYPNPFNAQTVVTFVVPEKGADDRVEILVYDIVGRVAKSLVCGTYAPGEYQVRWDGRTEAGDVAASGVYVCRMRAGAFQQSRRLLLLR